MAQSVNDKDKLMVSDITKREKPQHEEITVFRLLLTQKTESMKMQIHFVVNCSWEQTTLYKTFFQQECDGLGVSCHPTL